MTERRVNAILILMTLVLTAATVVALVGIASMAWADSPGPGDCSHGNSGRECRPDPQPSHGQDCEEHGQGGVNEDHCEEAQPTTVPTEEPSEEPTDKPSGTPTSTPSVGPDGGPVVGPSPETSESPRRTSDPHGRSRLPETGVGSTALLVTVGWLLFALGCLLKHEAKVREDNRKRETLRALHAYADWGIDYPDNND